MRSSRMALCALEDPGSFSVVTFSSLWYYSCSQSMMTYRHITLQSAEKQKRGKRCTSLLFKDTFQELYASLSLILSPMATVIGKATRKQSFYFRQPYSQLKIWSLLFTCGFQWFDYDVLMHIFFSCLSCLKQSKFLDSENLCLLPNSGTFHSLFLQIVFLAHSFPPGTPIT